jgi:hypothetical protein
LPRLPGDDADATVDGGRATFNLRSGRASGAIGAWAAMPLDCGEPPLRLLVLVTGAAPALLRTFPAVFLTALVVFMVCRSYR